MVTLKIKTLKKGWHDKDLIMLHAAFQLLTDYIELEKPEEIIDWSESPHNEAWKEIKYLYNWWTKKRPARKEKDFAEPLTKEEYKAYGLDHLDVITSNWKFKPDLPLGVIRKIENYKKKLLKLYEQMETWDNEDQENLERLVKIREHLWT